MPTRKERRAARKARRQQRLQQFDQIIQLAKTTPDVPDNFSDSDIAQGFTKYWPLLKAGLEFAEGSKITGKKSDAAISDVITIGDNIVSGGTTDAEQQEFIAKLQKAWNIISRVLNVATVFTNDDTDEVLQKVIDIGNWITGTDED